MENTAGKHQTIGEEESPTPKAVGWAFHTRARFRDLGGFWLGPALCSGGGGGSPFLSSRTPGAIPERTSDSAGEAFLFLSSTLVQHRICSFIYSFIQLFDKCFLSTRPCLGALGTPPENKQLWFLFSRQTATMTRATEGGTRSQQSW